METRQILGGRNLLRSLSSKREMKNQRSLSRNKQLNIESSMGHTVRNSERLDHCKQCTQCDYWYRKIEIYKRKIDRHIEQVKQAATNTAAFNSFAARQSPTINGTIASFGRNSVPHNSVSNFNKRKSSQKDSVSTMGTQSKKNINMYSTSMSGNGTASFNFQQKRRIGQKVRAENFSKSALLTGGVPSSLSRSKSAKRDNNSRQSLKGNSHSLSLLGNNSALLNNTITNIRVIKNSKKNTMIPLNKTLNKTMDRSNVSLNSRSRVSSAKRISTGNLLKSRMPKPAIPATSKSIKRKRSASSKHNKSTISVDRKSKASKTKRRSSSKGTAAKKVKSTLSKGDSLGKSRKQVMEYADYPNGGLLAEKRYSNLNDDNIVTEPIQDAP